MRRRVTCLTVLLMFAALACNLRVGGGDETPTGGRTQSQVPVVQILEPANSAQVIKGNKVTIRAQASSPTGVRMAELLVNDVAIPEQRKFPESEADNLFEALFEYQANQAGTLKFTVRAYSNEVVGSGSTTITVLDSLNPGAGGAGTPTAIVLPTATVSAVCRARVLINLNFRKGPGTEYEVISTFTAGQEPPIKGYADRAQDRWWQVTWGSQTGFISGNAQYSQRLGNCNTIGPVAIPPTPSPIPSLTPIPTQPGVTATPGPADLVLTQLAGVQTVELGPDGTVRATYVIRIKNIGGQTATQFDVDVQLPDGQIQTVGLVASLAPNQEIEFPAGGLNVTFNAPGVQRLLVALDPRNVVAESDENNNKAYMDITVTGSLPVETEEAEEGG